MLLSGPCPDCGRRTNTAMATMNLYSADALRVGLTLGDAAGIGPEVLVAALQHTRLLERAHCQLFLVSSWLPWFETFAAEHQLPTAREPTVGALELVVAGEAAGPPAVPGQPTVAGRRDAFTALQAMVAAAKSGRLDGVVTGPVPKGIFDHLTPRPPGQTEYLATELAAPRFAMMLAGPLLRVVPVTTHIPLQKVPEVLTTQAIVNASLAAAETLRHWFGLAAPRLAICGLNPHAGEDGRCGDEEARVIAPAVAQLQAAGITATGPVVADTVFYQAMAGRYDAVICMYHDQALGPLKTVHFHDAVNLTCGLPVPRLSPDHGTAYDLAGGGTASPESTIAALTLVERFARQNRQFRSQQQVADAVL